MSSYYSPIQLKKVTVSEIPDNMWNDIQTKHIRDMELEFDGLWREYLKTVPSRPNTKVDDNLEDISQKIKEANEVLEKHVEMQKKKYLTPAARIKNVDTRLQQLQNTILHLQREFEHTQKLVNELEETFQKNKKREFRFKWLTS
jgi:molecular chaperone GrpE (heat shock protein)